MTNTTTNDDGFSKCVLGDNFRTITVRVCKALYERVHAAATAQNKSMNLFTIEALETSLGLPDCGCKTTLAPSYLLNGDVDRRP